MKTATVKQLKIALESLPNNELLQICLRLTKFKKENKELLTYMLFEAESEAGYVISVQNTLSELFETVNLKHFYFAKKTVRKIVRIATKFIKYSNENSTEPDILIFICNKMIENKVVSKYNTGLHTLYFSLIKKIKKAVIIMHEDEQYDYLQAIERIDVKF